MSGPLDSAEDFGLEAQDMDLGEPKELRAAMLLPLPPVVSLSSERGNLGFLKLYWRGAGVVF